MSDENKCTIGKYEVEAAMKSIGDIVRDDFEDGVYPDIPADLSIEATAMIQVELERPLAVAGVEVKS